MGASQTPAGDQHVFHRVFAKVALQNLRRVYYVEKYIMHSTRYVEAKGKCPIFL